MGLDNIPVKELLLKSIQTLYEDHSIQINWKARKRELKKLADILQKLEAQIPEGYIPLRIACSALLTQRVSLKTINFPKSLQDWVEVWKQIKPKEMEDLSESVSCWL